MENINKLFELIDQCTIVSIVYNFRSERRKDLIIEKLNPIRINEVISEKFSIKTYLRDSVIDNILDEKKKVNTNIFYLDAVFLRHQHLDNTFEKIRIEFLGTNNKLIVSNHLNTGTTNFNLEAGSMKTLLHSDLAFTLDQHKNEGRIIKSRHTRRGVDISLEGLEDYNYLS